jgi:ATP-dependent helicase HepA
MQSGWIVQHAELGVGKTMAVNRGRISVNFIRENTTLILTDTTTLFHLLLPDATPCRTSNNELCKVVGKAETDQSGTARYKVEFETGLHASLHESDLTPLEIPPPKKPLDALSGLRHDGYCRFSAREALRKEQLSLLRRGGGVKALLSSRIDLHPHQAFVAGAIVLDARQRYLLADEVGLGKTIEAGIVIHDLLCKRPQANILILCPSSLVQQWLCEMYTKFSGRVFKVPEFTGHDWGSPAQVIISLSRALQVRTRLAQETWDLVVIDETHHLLHDKVLYELAKDLADQSPGLLLLSALPAQHRVEDYLRLLALLEPDRYSKTGRAEIAKFRSLYKRQVEIGRKLKYIGRRLDELEQDTSSREAIVAKVKELGKMEVLDADARIQAALVELESADGATFPGLVRDVTHYIGDVYRINRRIFRNRRNRLIELGQMSRIERKLERVDYDPDQFEMDAESAVASLLRTLVEPCGADRNALHLTQQVLQSLCCPQSLVKCLSLATNPPSSSCFQGNADVLPGYEDWELFVSEKWVQCIKSEDSKHSFEQALQTAMAWLESGEQPARFKSLIGLLKEKIRNQDSQKLIVFAGFPGAAALVAKVLSAAFSPQAVARFYHGMKDNAEEDRMAKEAEVRRFLRDDRASILVSDETGGEGRNFQFADGLIFFDLPWQIARVEQRIGRLDRLGRHEPLVTTHVICCDGSIESGLLECYDSGFGVFTRSISGLEFALRDLEFTMTETALSRGVDGLRELPPDIKQVSEKERAEDASHEMLDAASYERRRAERFLKTQSNPEQDKRLGSTFVRYIRSVSQADGARFIDDAWGAANVVQFRPGSIQGLELKLPIGPNGAPVEPRGTFRRELAQERPDLQFFSVGNDLFDAVCCSLDSCVVGRSYAIECRFQTRAWRGFEFWFTVVAGKLEHGRQSALDGVLSGNHTRVFIADDGKLEDPDFWLQQIKGSLTKENKGRAWMDLLGNNAQALVDFYGESQWGELLKRSEEIGRKEAIRKLRERLQVHLEEESKQLDQEVASVERCRVGDWMHVRDSLLETKTALSKWDVMLDSVGYLSVNGNLGGNNGV